jgi:mRNA interferase MazF
MNDVKDYGLKYNASRCYDPTAYEALKNIESEENKMQIFRGDIYYVKKKSDSKAAEAPAVVVSSNIANNKNKSVIVVWLSRFPENDAPTHVPVICQAQSTAMCENISTVYKDRIGNLIRSCTDAEMRQIDDALSIALGLGLYDASMTGTGSGTLQTMLSSTDKDDLINCLTKDLAESNAIIDELTKELQRKSTPVPEVDSIKIIAKRDLYKNLYEQLLAKMLSEKVG